MKQKAQIKFTYDELSSGKVFSELKNITDLNFFYIPEGEGGIEIHKLNNTYLLFTIHPYGGEPVFEGGFKHGTDLITFIIRLN